MVELGQGLLEHKQMIAPGLVVLDQPLHVLVRYDEQRKATIFFDFSTMLPLYVSSTRTVEGGTKVTVTKDSKGRTLFLITYPTKGKRLIFRAPPNLSRSCSAQSLSPDSLTSSSSHSSASVHDESDPLTSYSRNSRRGSLSRSTDPQASCSKASRHGSNSHATVPLTSHSRASRRSSMSNASDPITLSSKTSRRSSMSSATNPRTHGSLDSDFHQSSSTRSLGSVSSDIVARSFVRQQLRQGGDVPCVAQIDLHRSGATATAVLSVVVWNGSTRLESVYKACQLSQVKSNALVVDMQGQVVGKACLDDRRMQPIINVAAGADIPSVIVLASALLGNF